MVRLPGPHGQTISGPIQSGLGTKKSLGLKRLDERFREGRGYMFFPF